MFFLGILVGRGTSPVTFDTKSFNTRLEAIVQSYGKTDAPSATSNQGILTLRLKKKWTFISMMPLINLSDMK